MPDDLASAVDALFEAFATYPAREWVPACACCFDAEPDAPGTPAQLVDFSPRGTVMLRSPGFGAPLRQIPASELASFAENAPGLFGEESDWKHYLPRLLEITTGSESWDWPSPEIVIGKLRRGCSIPWTEWPADEVAAVRATLRAYWANELSLEIRSGDAYGDMALCAIGGAEPDIAWYLTTWQTFDDSHAGRRLLRLLVESLDELAEGHLASPFWDEDDELSKSNEDTIVNWLRSSDLADAVKNAAARHGDSEEGLALLEALDLLQSLTSPDNRV